MGEKRFGVIHNMHALCEYNFIMAATEEHKTLNANELADYLLCESRERGELLTPLKLQKLMFYADAWYMALYDDELITEGFQAWVHGPVAPSQWHRFKEYRWNAITTELEKPQLGSSVKKHLDEIIDIFGSETAVSLERMTHQETPWLEARGGIPDDEPCNNYISKTTTRDFYKSLGQD
ncbi:MAG: Panacea domain-containing protein [Allorhizobium sp.]